MKVVVSILHYKNQEDTKECLKSLSAINQSGIEVKVIVVDNSQEKNLKLGKYESLDIEIVKTTKNLGFTGGHNLAFNKTKKDDYDVFLLLNNDCIVDEDFLIELVRPFNEKNIGATVSKIYFSLKL